MRAEVLFVVIAACAAQVACRSVPRLEAPLVAPIGRTAAGAPIQTAEATAGAGRPGREKKEENAGDAIHPCDASSGEGMAAQAALDALGTRIEGLADDADPKVAAAELDALLATECFRMSFADTSHPRFATALSMRTWWQNGGQDWVGHYIGQTEKRTVVIPPTPRKALFASRSAATPLGPLLCPAGSTSCGRETIGWLRRADQSLERRAKSRGYGGETADTCAKEAEKEEPENRYTHFRGCLEGVALTREALPLGRFKAPTEGWLFVRDALRIRINSAMCETLRAYDLTSGAAYILEECTTSSLMAPHVLKTRTGRVGVAALREATWMLAMAQASERQVRTQSETFEVPEPIVIERAVSQSSSRSYLCGSSRSSGTREWSWMRDDKKGTLTGQMSGRLRTSGSSEAAAHALELLAIVDDGFEQGCTPAPPPARVAWAEAGPALPNHESSTLTGPELEDARAALGQTRGPGTCRKAP